MESLKLLFLDEKNRDVYTVWKNIDETDVKILEGLSALGPRNLTLIAKHLDMPVTSLRYRVKRLLDYSLLFIHLNPYHTNMGLKKAVVFVEAIPGYEDVLLDCLKANDFWVFLSRIYGPYEGWGAIWTVPKSNDHDFESFLNFLVDSGVARSFEINWTTCHEGIPVTSRWFNVKENVWSFNWPEWVEEVKTNIGELPWTLVEPDDWPVRVDYEDLLIIKEFEIDGRKSLADVSRKLGIPVERLKYHFKEHVSKRRLIEGYQIDIARFPILFSNYLFFRFEFSSYEKFVRFTTSLHDKPFPLNLGKVIGENTLISHMFLPIREFRKFIDTLSELIKLGLLNRYRYFIQDVNKTWRETIPYEHFVDGGWHYDSEKHLEEVVKIIGKRGFSTKV